MKLFVQVSSLVDFLLAGRALAIEHGKLREVDPKEAKVSLYDPLPPPRLPPPLPPRLHRCWSSHTDSELGFCLEKPDGSIFVLSNGKWCCLFKLMMKKSKPRTRFGENYLFQTQAKVWIFLPASQTNFFSFIYFHVKSLPGFSFLYCWTLTVLEDQLNSWDFSSQVTEPLLQDLLHDGVWRN